MTVDDRLDSQATALFRQRLAQARAQQGRTMAQLAALAGIRSRGNVWWYESGGGQPTLALVERLASALEVDAAWLSGLPGKGEEPKERKDGR